MSAVGQTVAPGVRLVGHIESPRITESSGLVASRRHPGVFWTHTDGGGGAKQVLSAMTREGKTLGEHVVGGVRLQDWEDLAIDGDGHLYIGDLGNNTGKRTQLAVYAVDEPDPRGQGWAMVKRSWHLRYPGRPFDCESLFLWETNGYIISKVVNDEPAEVFRFPLVSTPEPLTLEPVARLKVTSPVSGACISEDGRLMGLVAKSGAFVFQLDRSLARLADLKPHRIRLRDAHIEGCCFVPDGMLATAETREIYLFTGEAFQAGK